MLSINSHPALAVGTSLTLTQRREAAVSITQSQLKEAEDLYELIRKRTGKDLPKLTSSPNVKASSSDSIRSSLSPSSLSQAFSDADAQSIAQLKAELEKINRELQEKSRLAESEKKELLKLEESLEQLRSSSSSGGSGKGAEEDSDGAFSLLNVMGILVGGGLAGYVYLQKNEAKGTQEELTSALSKEQVLVNDLKSKAAAVQASLEFEQEIVSKMKREISKIQQDSSQLLSTEKREKESAIRASELANKALEAERNLVKAVRKETAAAQEQAQAERAAKFVAEAESAAVAKQLKDTQEQLANQSSQLEKERVVARKIGMDASKAMAQVGTFHTSLSSGFLAFLAYD